MEIKLENVRFIILQIHTFSLNKKKAQKLLNKKIEDIEILSNQILNYFNDIEDEKLKIYMLKEKMANTSVELEFEFDCINIEFKWLGEFSFQELKDIHFYKYLYNFCETTGFLTMEYGLLPAFSLKSDWYDLYFDGNDEIRKLDQLDQYYITPIQPELGKNAVINFKTISNKFKAFIEED